MTSAFSTMDIFVASFFLIASTSSSPRLSFVHMACSMAARASLRIFLALAELSWNSLAFSFVMGRPRTLLALGGFISGRSAILSGSSFSFSMKSSIL